MNAAGIAAAFIGVYLRLKNLMNTLVSVMNYELRITNYEGIIRNS